MLETVKLLHVFYVINHTYIHAEVTEIVVHSGHMNNVIIFVLFVDLNIWHMYVIGLISYMKIKFQVSFIVAAQERRNNIFEDIELGLMFASLKIGILLEVVGCLGSYYGSLSMSSPNDSEYDCSF